MILAEFTSFDHVSAASFVQQYGFFQPQNAPPLVSWSGTPTFTTGWNDAGQALRNPSAIKYTIPSSGAVFLNTFDVAIVRVRFKPTSMGAERVVLEIANDGSTTIQLRVTTAGMLKIQMGGSSVAGPWTSVSHTPLVVDTWHNIEFGVYVHDTAGSTRVKLDGRFVKDLSIDNVDTHGDNGSVAASFNQVVLDNAAADFDDWYLKLGNNSLNEEEFLTNKSGNPKVLTLFPIGLGIYEEWASLPNIDGEHYKEIDDMTPDGDTTYLAAAEKDLRMTFQFQKVVVPGSITTTPVAPDM